ncbi:MAG: M15 family metallopeptidase [Deltaproteobacteria bacterium]|nr:M15 family metallopeptidase [Deltaproteobacteria bacterium]
MTHLAPWALATLVVPVALGCAGSAGMDAGVPPTDGAAGCFGAPATGLSGRSDAVGAARQALTIDSLVATGCTTTVVADLSEQLIGELECLMPGQMARIDADPSLALGSAVFPWLQRPAAEALIRAAAGGGTLRLNSGLRTLPQQYLLYRWYQAGRCGISLAASPGTSNHESGVAIDVSDYATWQGRLEAEGFAWFGAGDAVHFDYRGAGATDLRGLSVLAFQRLWNRNHPEDLIEDDGLYGPDTESRLALSPAEGFAMGATCGTPTEATLGLEWSADRDGVYTFTTLATDDVERVLYRIDGVAVGTATKADGVDFAVTIAGCFDDSIHEITGEAVDIEGNLIGDLVGWFEARESNALAVRPLGPGIWEFGLDRPSADTGAILILVDGFPVTDLVSDTSRATRLAVLSRVDPLGAREITLRRYDGADTLIDTKSFTITFR